MLSLNYRIFKYEKLRLILTYNAVNLIIYNLHEKKNKDYYN